MFKKIIAIKSIDADIDRYEKPKVIDDIGAWFLFNKKGTKYYTVGSKEKDSFIVVPQDKMRYIVLIKKLLNGNNTVQEVEGILLNNYNAQIDILPFLQLLKKQGLLENANDKALDNSELSKLSIKLFEIDLSKYKRNGKYLPDIYKLWPVVTGIFVFGLGLIINTGIQGKDVLFSLGKSNIYGFLLICILGYLFRFFHEAAHCIEALRCGLIPKKFRIALYLGFIPVLYLIIHGIYTIPAKKRLKVWGAGPYINTMLFGLFSIVMLIPFKEILVNQIIAKAALFNLFSLVF